jgi:hypothetical protein
MADFGILPGVYEVDQSGDWSDYLALITSKTPLVLDNLAGCTATAWLVSKTDGSITNLTVVVTQPNIITWSSTYEVLHALASGPYILKVKIVRANGFRQIALRGEVVLVP